MHILGSVSKHGIQTSQRSHSTIVTNTAIMCLYEIMAASLTVEHLLEKLMTWERGRGNVASSCKALEFDPSCSSCTEGTACNIQFMMRMLAKVTGLVQINKTPSL